MPFKNLTGAIQAGKSDAYAKAVGGFVVAKMPDEKYDYFPSGQPPHIVQDGQINKCGEIQARFVRNSGRWKRIG